MKKVIILLVFCAAIAAVFIFNDRPKQMPFYFKFGNTSLKTMKYYYNGNNAHTTAGIRAVVISIKNASIPFDKIKGVRNTTPDSIYLQVENKGIQALAINDITMAVDTDGSHNLTLISTKKYFGWKKDDRIILPCLNPVALHMEEKVRMSSFRLAQDEDKKTLFLFDE